jgi:hypothetical protein
MAEDLLQNAAPFPWTEGKLEAVYLLAQDELTDEEIAARVSVHRATLARWKRHPQFAARLQAAVAELGEVAQRYALGRRAYRVRCLNDRHQRMRRVIEQRAADPSMQGVPGGDTGLLVRDVKVVGQGEHAQRVDLYRVDTGLLAELRATEEQAARELGQWSDRQETTVTGTVAVQPAVDYSKLSDDEVRTLYALQAKARVGQPGPPQLPLPSRVVEALPAPGPGDGSALEAGGGGHSELPR